MTAGFECVWTVEARHIFGGCWNMRTSQKSPKKIERERVENERKAHHHHHHKKQRDFVCVSLFISFPDFLPPLDTKPNGCCEIIFLLTETRM